MKRTNLLLASVGGTAVLAVAGVAIGVTAANDSRTDTTLAAATVAPTADSTTVAPATSDPSSTGTPSGTPASGAPSSADVPSSGGAPAGAPSSGGAPAGAAVDEKRAGEIALAKAGGGQIVEVEAEQEHGRPVWSVEIVAGDTEHEVDVDRENGSVVKAEQEPVDDGDDADDKDDDADDGDDD